MAVQMTWRDTLILAVISALLSAAITVALGVVIGKRDLLSGTTRSRNGATFARTGAELR
jgi:hypothetical protein